MYILEIIHANKDEDLFFEDTDAMPEPLKKEFNLFNDRIDEICVNDIYKKKLTVSSQRNRLADGTYTLNIRKSFFKSAAGAERYWNTYFNQYNNNHIDLYEITKYKKDWQQLHDIRTEVNIIDINGSHIKTLNSCMQGICARFTTCSPDADCWEKHEVKTHVSYHHIPVESIISRRKPLTR